MYRTLYGDMKRSLKVLFIKSGRLLRKNKGPCQEHSRDEHRIWVDIVFPQKARIHFLNSYEWSH